MNDWEHYFICVICMHEEVVNAQVKLGSNDSPQVLVDHFQKHTTSAPAERLLSVTGQVVTATRNRLHPETVTLLVFLHETLPVHRDIKFQRLLDKMKMDGDVEVVDRWRSQSRG